MSLPEKTSPYRETNGPTSMAGALKVNRIFSPGEEVDGIPYDQNIKWLAQFTHGANGYPLSPNLSYILIGEETYPDEIWEATDPQNHDKISSPFKRIWRSAAMKDFDVTITAKVTKTLRVSAATPEEAGEIAHERFSVLNDDNQEKYEQDTDKIQEVEENEG